MSDETARWPWGVLGLPDSGNDKSAVRKAYAARLKAIDPEDLAQFQPLRKAYDAALLEVRYGGQPASPPSPAPIRVQDSSSLAGAPRAREGQSGERAEEREERAVDDAAPPRTSTRGPQVLPPAPVPSAPVSQGPDPQTAVDDEVLGEARALLTRDIFALDIWKPLLDRSDQLGIAAMRDFEAAVIQRLNQGARPPGYVVPPAGWIGLLDGAFGWSENARGFERKFRFAPRARQRVIQLTTPARPDRPRPPPRPSPLDWGAALFVLLSFCAIFAIIGLWLVYDLSLGRVFICALAGQLLLLIVSAGFRGLYARSYNAVVVRAPRLSRATAAVSDWLKRPVLGFERALYVNAAAVVGLTVLFYAVLPTPFDRPPLNLSPFHRMSTVNLHGNTVSLPDTLHTQALPALVLTDLRNGRSIGGLWCAQDGADDPRTCHLVEREIGTFVHRIRHRESPETADETISVVLRNPMVRLEGRSDGRIRAFTDLQSIETPVVGHLYEQLLPFASSPVFFDVTLEGVGEDGGFAAPFDPSRRPRLTVGWPDPARLAEDFEAHCRTVTEVETIGAVAPSGPATTSCRVQPEDLILRQATCLPDVRPSDCADAAVAASLSDGVAVEMDDPGRTLLREMFLRFAATDPQPPLPLTGEVERLRKELILDYALILDHPSIRAFRGDRSKILLALRRQDHLIGAYAAPRSRRSEIWNLFVANMANAAFDMSDQRLLDVDGKALPLSEAR